MRWLLALVVWAMPLLAWGGERAGRPTPQVAEADGGGIRSILSVVRHSFGADCAAAEEGDAEAAYRVGRRYLFGAGVRRSRPAGVAWMRLAAARGHGEARRVLALVPRNWGRGKASCSQNPYARGPVVRPPPEQIVKLVNTLAPTYRLDPALVLAVIQIESAFDAESVSPKQAMGLMQLIPGTADRFGVSNVFDPEDNIRGGMKYLRWLLCYFRGDVALALAGYNAGERAVDRHGGIPPYAETQGYVRLIHQLYPHPSHPFEAGAASEVSPLAGRTKKAGPAPQER